VKLSTVSWERKLYGKCNYYYTWSLEFDINFETHDKSLLDEGTKALGHWDPTTKEWVTTGDLSDSAVGTGTEGDVLEPDPTRFNHYKDKNGENARCILDGYGVPVTSVEDAGIVLVKKYGEEDLLLLGIPTTL
jgi:hypothetical protein